MTENIVNEELLEEEKTNKHFPLVKKDRVFANVFFAVSTIFAFIALCGGFRIGYTIASPIMLIAITVYLWNKTTKIKFFPLVCGFLSLILPAIFVITSNGEVRFWSFVATTLMSCVWFGSLVGVKSSEGDLELPRNILGQFFSGMFGKMPKTFSSLIVTRTESNKSFGKVLLGVALALPVLLIVVPLLISSDEAFAGFTVKFFGNMSESVFRIFVGILLTPFVIAYCFALKHSEKKDPKPVNFDGIDNTIVISFLSVLSVCYLAYLFSQLAYFFSAFSGFLPNGYKFNVSTYARRGFFEMSAIAAINFVIIFGALLLSKKIDRKICIPSRLICLFISLFTLVIISTALSKMVLYIRELGMTRLRITTSAFMVFLGVVFITLIFRLFFKKVMVLRVALVTAALVLIVLGGANVNRVVAAYNYEAYQNNVLKEIDVKTIYKLGDEGIPYLVKLTEDKDEEVVTLAHTYLEKAITNRYYNTDYNYFKGEYTIEGKRFDSFDNYSISRAKAYKLLDEYIPKRPEKFVLSEVRI